MVMTLLWLLPLLQVGWGMMLKKQCAGARRTEATLFALEESTQDCHHLCWKSQSSPTLKIASDLRWISPRSGSDAHTVLLLDVEPATNASHYPCKRTEVYKGFVQNLIAVENRPLIPPLIKHKLLSLWSLSGLSLWYLCDHAAQSHEKQLDLEVCLEVFLLKKYKRVSRSDLLADQLEMECVNHIEQVASPLKWKQGHPGRQSQSEEDAGGQ